MFNAIQSEKYGMQFQSPKSLQSGCVTQSTGTDDKSNKPFTDVFISYDWGSEIEGYPHQKRVLNIIEELQKRGLKRGLRIWLDKILMAGNMTDKMTSGIENT